METAAILVLRKVLDPENPAHQRIIDASQPPDEQEEGEGESANVTSAAASTSSPIGNGLSPRHQKKSQGREVSEQQSCQARAKSDAKESKLWGASRCH